MTEVSVLRDKMKSDTNARTDKIFYFINWSSKRDQVARIRGLFYQLEQQERSSSKNKRLILSTRGVIEIE